VSGAALRRDYFRLVEEAGLRDVSVLKEEDYAAALAQLASDEAQTLLQRWGITLDQIRGAITSVTWRAVKG
jgi:hypothetical protein